MKTHFEIRSVRNIIGSALAGMLVLCFFAVAISGQAPPNPIPPQENIPAGALVIPMDNVNQGNAGGTTFNLRAYGLVNALLQNNVPVKWAIKPNKAKDAEDFSANVTRIAGAAGVAGPASVSFSGGPFIVPVEYDTTTVRDLITNFNSGGTDVVVYKTNANVLVDVRYNVTHKPLIAIGPDGGNFGTGVHQDLFDSAGIPNYTSVTDDIITANSCYSLATQAHSTDPTFVNLYSQFAQSGGNLLLQCASVNTFENAAAGHFQTLAAGYSVFGTNAPANAVDTTLVYPEGSMPFNQFIGILANQDGAITEYAYAPGGGPANSNRVSVRNSAPDAEKFVATVSQLNTQGSAGGTVFELGGHDYARTNTGATEIARLNGQRMILNAVFVPVNRPQSCGLAQATVNGYKSVRRQNVRNGGPPLIAEDTLRWTIDYINNSPVDINNFQIRDIVSSINGVLTGNLTLVPGTNQVTILQGGATGTRNPNYDGIGDDATSDMLNPGAFLPVGGRIQMTVDMKINKFLADGVTPLPNDTILWNQPDASGSTLQSTTKTDAIDTTNTTIFGIDPPPAGSFAQFQNPGILDPTIARIKTPGGPTSAAASVEGEVRDSNGAAIRGAVVTAVNASTGVRTSVRTNSQGQYRIGDLRVGEFYLVTADHKQYIFPGGSVTFTLNDNVTGLTFVGSLPERAEETSKPLVRKTTR